ncbi:MAG: DJ-1/PfpI family protein [Prevotella sp.]|nr:DJ-1/PfpI family protein [Prevotella sp.]
MKVYVFLADGFETVEALAPIDIMRRAGLEVVTVSIMDTVAVTSAQQVMVMADVLFEAVASFDDAELLVLPGGMPGADYLDKFEPLRRLLVAHHANGRRIAAICAAPMVLGHLGLLRGRRATCYPGFEGHLDGADYTAELVTCDGPLTTACGPGAAMAFGYELVGQLLSGEVAESLREGMRYNQLMEEK